MTADRDTTRIVRSWLRTDEHDSADRILDGVLARLDTTPQRRPLWPSRRHALMNRVGIAVTAAAVVVVAVGIVGLNLLPASGGPGPSASAGASPSAPSATSSAMFRREQTVDGIKFSVETRGWESYGPRGDPMPRADGLAPISLNRSYQGPQGAEGMIYWTSPFAALYTDPCQKILGTPGDVSIAELATIIAAAPGAALVSGPSDITIGGRPAKFLVVTVREDIGCDPGYFFAWDDYPGGPMYRHTEIGDTIRVWIIDVDGRSLFIAGETHLDGGARADRDIREMVESIEFE